ncbi:hypothetical protein NOVO_02800 [Rickettsiales bacterium Ac37b]|nr:hypothetical protein NOVO_02800 [Rickettsiales bacterium Ac37b]
MVKDLISKIPFKGIAKTFIFGTQLQLPWQPVLQSVEMGLVESLGGTGAFLASSAICLTAIHVTTEVVVEGSIFIGQKVVEGVKSFSTSLVKNENEANPVIEPIINMEHDYPIIEIGIEAEGQRKNLEHASLKTSDLIDMPIPEGVSNEDPVYDPDHEVQIKSVNISSNDAITQGTGNSNLHVIENIIRSESLTNSHVERVGKKRKNYNRSDDSPIERTGRKRNKNDEQFKLIIRPERTVIFEDPNTELRPKNHLNGVERLSPSSYQKKEPRCTISRVDGRKKEYIS